MSEKQLFHDYWLLDVFGRAVRYQRFLFVSCAIEFSFATPAFVGSTFSHGRFPAIVTSWRSGDDFVDEDPTVFWCRSRIMALFGHQPVFSQTSWMQNFIFQTSFLAVDTSQPYLNAVPFVLTDWDGLPYDDYAELDFIARIGFPVSVSANSMRMIAECFWNLLLNDPYAIREYSDYLNDGHCISRITFDRTGPVLVPMTPDQPELDDESSDHANFGYFPHRTCQDCKGLGEEYVRYPIRQTCETCNGTGIVTW